MGSVAQQKTLCTRCSSSVGLLGHLSTVLGGIRISEHEKSFGLTHRREVGHHLAGFHLGHIALYSAN